MIRSLRKDHAYWLPAIAIALVLSFVVHDVQLRHEHPFTPHAHGQGPQPDQQHGQNDDAFVSVYTHGDRKDFLALLLLIAAVPGVFLIAHRLPYIPMSPRPIAAAGPSYDYHRLLFRRGILHSKRY